MGDSTGAFDPTRKEASLAPPTTHQYIPAAGPPQEEKKDEADNVSYFLSNLMMGQGTPGAFPMPAPPEKKSDEEKVHFVPPFLPMPMQMPVPPQPGKESEGELKDKKKPAQGMPFMPAYPGGLVRP
ncbi:hypothetical protein KEM56_004962 [Ascosphaera pollenicola]|nr:hypothetical protein KEM56_004962 [Ascosphaera pollenicola]